MMKFIILVIVTVTTSKALEIPGLNIKSYMEQCSKDFKIDVSVFQPGKTPDASLMKTKAYKCFGHCVSMKAGLVNAAGDIVPDKLKTIMPLGGLEKAMECSKANKQSDKCDRVASIKDCIKQKLPGVIPNI